MDGIGVVWVLLSLFFCKEIEFWMFISFSSKKYFCWNLHCTFFSSVTSKLVNKTKWITTKLTTQRSLQKKINENFNKFTYQIGWVTRPLFPHSSDLHSLYKSTLFLSRQFCWLFLFGSYKLAELSSRNVFPSKFLWIRKKTDQKLNFSMQCNCRWTMWFTHSLSPSLCFNRLCFYGGTVCTP